MPKPHLLETFPNPYPDRDYDVHMECPEFTSLCPLGGIEGDAGDLRALEGGAPDFATMHIRYVPGAKCVELKSLKLYLWSFRDKGAFAEDMAATILNDLVADCEPEQMTVDLTQKIRGGLKLRTVVRHGEERE